MARTRTLLVLIAAVAVPVWLWQRADPPNVAAPASSSAPKAATAPKATSTDARTPLSGSTSAGAAPTVTAPASPDAGVTARSTFPAQASRSHAVRLDVLAPQTTRIGDRFTITIDAEALGPIRKLSFVVNYDRHMLQFVSSSAGSIVQLASAPVSLSADDSSAGSVLVHMKVQNEGMVAAAGTVVVLEFNALHAGTSPITLDDVSYVESGRSSGSSAAALRPASVTIEQG